MDIYTEAKVVSDLLAREGHPEDGKRLIDSIENGSTSTEILMALRWHAQKVESSGITVSSYTRERIRRLLSELEKVLDA